MPKTDDAVKWIDKRERMPTEADCDEHGCILAWHEMKGAEVVHLSNLLRYGGFYTHWMPLPARP